jgi:hypothetical protein
LSPTTPILWLFVAAVFFGPMAYRLITPTPPEDVKAIELFLKNRDQTLLSLRKLWIGGPSVVGARGGYKQVGRPYRVLAQGADGKRWRHDVAVDVGQRDVFGDPKLKQRVLGQWLPVIQ